MGDYRTTKGEPLPATPRQRKRRLRRVLLIVLALVLATGILSVVVNVPRRVRAGGYVTTEDYAEVKLRRRALSRTSWWARASACKRMIFWCNWTTVFNSPSWRRRAARCAKRRPNLPGARSRWRKSADRTRTVCAARTA